jgi:outer membrane lipoprotein-sorting protein
MRRFLALLLLLSSAIHQAGAQDAREIVRRADAKSRGKTSTAEITIKVIRKDWEKDMDMRTWSKGNDKAMVLVTAPAKERGIAYLRKGREVWNWIPSIERNIKLPPSMMSQSWLGTDFTNDDLVKEASIVEDYSHKLIGKETLDGFDCFMIELKPVPSSNVVWGKVLLWVDSKEDMMLKAEYYDEDGQLAQTLRGYDIREIGGRRLPTRMEMLPAAHKGNRTVMIYRDVHFDVQISDDLFSPAQLERLQ